MKWLQDNPLGMALAGISGFFVLLALIMAIVWSLPVSVETSESETADAVSADSVMIPVEVGALAKYQIINEKPVFNESRTPQLVAVDDEGPEEKGTIEIKGAPEVKLTGVVIAPGKKVASLTPIDGELESVMAQEGQSLSGEYVGWQVSSIHPRAVVLESRDGQKLELELQIHDATIEEPPKPVAPLKTAQSSPGEDGQMAGDDEPLSRAEQIRQRIAERREELRLEQEEQQAQDGVKANARPKTSPYQSEIRSLMNKGKDKGNNDKKDG
jgi:hypothetical protein